jgi:hypothetical protein
MLPEHAALLRSEAMHQVAFLSPAGAQSAVEHVKHARQELTACAPSTSFRHPVKPLPICCITPVLQSCSVDAGRGCHAVLELIRVMKMITHSTMTSNPPKIAQANFACCWTLAISALRARFSADVSRAFLAAQHHVFRLPQLTMHACMQSDYCIWRMYS